MTLKHKKFSEKLARFYVNHPWFLIIIAVILTIGTGYLAEHLEMRMNWTDLLPSGNPTVQGYRNVQERFGNASGVVVALEGDYDKITEAAAVLEVELKKIESLYNVSARMPEDFFRDHALVLLKPKRFSRTLKMYSDHSMVGMLSGMNDDYEREYVDNEDNLKNDEVEVARGMLGLHRSLEKIEKYIQGEGDSTTVVNAVDAMMIGDPWAVSLDRKLLLISCQPIANEIVIDEYTAAAADVQAVVAKIQPQFPDVYMSLSGSAKIFKDEMDTINLGTQLLSLLALVLIYFLLARVFHGWIMPVIALLPLGFGITWTMGILYLLYGALNIFTSMMMLILIGLGIDFSIHLVSRYREEAYKGKSAEEAFVPMIAETGRSVVTGALTTAAAFLTLLIAETDGVVEFGVASGGGVIVTLISIFVMLPPLLVIRERILKRRKKPVLTFATRMHEEIDAKSSVPLTSGGFSPLGNVAVWVYNHWPIMLSLGLVIGIVSYFAARNTQFEYDFLELEAKGLRSVELQRQIPERFGTSDHAAWVVVDDVEKSRALKEEFKDVADVGEVYSISDYIPAPDRHVLYREHIENFRKALEKKKDKTWQDSDKELLADELKRLLVNLDVVGNLAYTAGLERIEKTIGNIVGVHGESDVVDTNAVLPRLIREIRQLPAENNLAGLSKGWQERSRFNLMHFANNDKVELSDLPETVLKNHLPRDGGEGYLLQVIPRRYLWNRDDLDRFAANTVSIDPRISGTEQLVTVMMDSTLSDGGHASILALSVIIVLLLIHFRGPLGLLSLVPLIFGTLIMLGLMHLFGMKYNYMNMITVPIILGIGIDDGIHALHRWKHEEERGAARIFTSFSQVGLAILLTSVTTMIGFGSVGFYEMRGMASFGQVLFMGVGACFLATLFLLPATLRFAERKNKDDKTDETVKEIEEEKEVKEAVE